MDFLLEQTCVYHLLVAYFLPGWYLIFINTNILINTCLYLHEMVFSEEMLGTFFVALI